MPTLDDFKKKPPKKFSKDSEKNWTVDVSPPDIKKRDRPGRGRSLRLLDIETNSSEEQSALPSPTVEPVLQDSETHKRSDRKTSDNNSVIANRSKSKTENTKLTPQGSSDSNQTKSSKRSLPSPAASTQPAPESKTVLHSNNSVATREQSLVNSVATRKQSPIDSVATRKHSTEDMEATREQFAVDSVATREHLETNSAANKIDTVAKENELLPSNQATREQIEATREHLTPNSGANREHIKSNSVANQTDTVAKYSHFIPSVDNTREQLESDSVANTADMVAYSNRLLPTHQQTLDKIDTTRKHSVLPTAVTENDLVANDSQLLPSLESTREQITYNSGATREHFPDNTEATRKQLYENLEATRERNVDDSGATREHLTPDSVAISENIKINSGAVVDLDSVAKQSPKKRILPRSQHQLTLLLYLLDQQIANDGINTPMLSRIQLARATGIAKDTLKNAIDRLEEKHLIVRNGFSRACNRGGTVYSVSNYIRKDLQNIAKQGMADSVANPRYDSVANNSAANQMMAVRSSSRLINTTSTTTPDSVENPDQDYADRFTAIVQRLRLEEKGIGANDLLSVWRRVLQRGGLFKKFEDLEQSLEHLAFYLDTKDATGLKNPKAWLLKEIERGYYPAPAGFVSLEERQEEAKLADLKKRLERLREIQSQKFEAEFEIWFSGLSEGQKKAITGTMNPGSRASMAVFRSTFAEEKGIVLPQEHTKAGV